MFQELYKDRNWLIEQYWGFDLSLKDISKLVNCTPQCIYYWMEKYNISTRQKFHHLGWLNQNFEHQSKAGKARAKWTNDHYSHLARERLLKNGNYLGCLSHIKYKERDPGGYYQKQRNAGIKGGEVIRKRITDWNFFNKYGYLKSSAGRKSRGYSIEFNKKLKQQILTRDGGLCQLCHKLIWTGDHGNGHAIHHIDYDKTNNDSNNLILLCKSCHNKTNVFNRDYWKNHLQKRIK